MIRRLRRSGFLDENIFTGRSAPSDLRPADRTQRRPLGEEWSGPGGFVGSNGLRLPDNVPGQIYFLGLLGPALLSAALSVQLTLTAVLAVKPPTRDTSRLTGAGLRLGQPERDGLLYLGSIAVAIVLAFVMVVAWNRRVRSVDPPAASSFVLRSLALQVGVAAVGTGLSVNQFLQARIHLQADLPIPPLHFAILGAVGLLSVVAGMWGGIKGDRDRDTTWLLRTLRESTGIKLPELRFSPLDLIIPLLIVVTIYVPEWRQLAGRFFVDERLGHWDTFIMHSALAFDHGKDLGIDVSTMYSIGWPMVFSAFFSLTPPSYGRLIQVGSMYACTYLTGVYLLLRLLVRRAGLAALGTAIVAMHLLLGIGSTNIWRYPSMTVLRFSQDVWCFIALTLHWKGQRRVWAAAAGAFAGLAVLFATDTGLSLVAACGFYWLSILWMDGDRPGRLRDMIAFGVSALGVLLAGLALAAHGRIFVAEFWRGWLESVLQHSEGFMAFALATVPDAANMLLFVVLFFSYMVFLAYALGRLAHKRARHFEIFNGCLAVYGLLAMMHFVGVSLFMHSRLWVPLMVILIHLGGRAYEGTGSLVQGRRGEKARNRVSKLAPLAVVAVVTLVIVATPGSLLVTWIRHYPNLASEWLGESSPEGVCLMTVPRDLCGLPAGMNGAAAEFREVSQQFADSNDSGKTAAVFDESGSLMYLASGTAPWGRYAQLFWSLVTKEKLATFITELRKAPPDYVWMRTAAKADLVTKDQSSYSDEDYQEFYRALVFGLGPIQETPYPEFWSELNSLMHELYVMERRAGPYEVWRLNVQESAGLDTGRGGLTPSPRTS